MGNCIGKKSTITNQQRRHSPSTTITPIKLYSIDQRPAKKQAPSFILASPLNTSSERNSIYLSDVKETDIIFNDNDESERKVIQYSSPSLLPTTTLPTNDQLIFMHIPSTLSPVQLSSECKKFKSSNTSSVIVFGKNNIQQSFTLTKNERDTTMGHLFSNEKDTNKENDMSDGNEKVNIDIKVHQNDNDDRKNHQYLIVINDQNVPSIETMVNTQGIIFPRASFTTSLFVLLFFKIHLTFHLRHLCSILHFLHCLAIRHHSLLKID
jgi:hypothetical protein